MASGLCAGHSTSSTPNINWAEDVSSFQSLLLLPCGESLQCPCSSHTPKTVKCGDASLKHTHTHTQLCNGVEFMAALKFLPTQRSVLCYSKAPSTPLRAALSLTLQSSPPIISVLFITFVVTSGSVFFSSWSSCCHSLHSVLLCFPFPCLSLSPILSFHISSAPQCLLSSPNILFSSFLRFNFCMLSPSYHSSFFFPKCLCVINIWFDLNLLFSVSLMHTYISDTYFFPNLLALSFFPIWPLAWPFLKNNSIPFV